MRVAVVDKERCKPHKCGHECIKACPVNRKGEECVYLNEEETRALIDEELCIGCKLCVSACPFDAIKVVNTPEKLEEKPVHRYGPNMFELFRMPNPKPNRVMGIIGRNGIGKTTALEILSGEINPNFGNFENPLKEEKIIKKYSNTELGDYFKKLFSEGIRIAYKPQRIEKIPEYYKGKVKELIEKVDERDMASKVIKGLGMSDLTERKVSQLSGGELQRLAISATIAKDADVYYFDEPASFLDVNNRMQAAKLIRSLKAVNKSIVVVEHDLAILDYITDEVQIIYGKPGAFGIVSQSKSVRRGINEYMDGFLPEDNVRFRDYKIKFSKSPEEREISEKVVLKFPKLEKSFENFHLKVNSGEIYTGEVLTAMGANGLGKTTFLKLLAGLEEPDKGEIEKEIKIAYKPQYPSSEIEGTVESYLRGIIGKDFYSSWYKSIIIEGLGLNRLLDMQVKNLSGGELQKVYTASTLSKEAMIYAFDEPSAFVDVEDRLKVGEVIRKYIQHKEVAAIVVDHDVQLVDYIGDRMLVFEGIPGKKGKVYGPCSKVEGMNRVLKMLDITYRRDKETNRPKINKPNSVLDREQREKGEYYYT